VGHLDLFTFIKVLLLPLRFVAVLLTNLICFNVSHWLCSCDCNQEQLYIALVCVSMSLSMIVSWFMFVLYWRVPFP